MAYIFVYLFLALPTCALFLFIAFLPDALFAFLKVETVPVLVRGIAGVFGILLLAASLAALRHGLRLQWLIRENAPKPVRVSVAVHDSSDTTNYTATAHFKGSEATWQTPIYYNKAVDQLMDYSARNVEGWSDPKNGAPIAFRVDGRLVYTYPKATRTHRSVRP